MTYLLTHKLGARLYATLTIAALLMSALPMQLPVAGAAAPDKVTVCHSTGSDSNPYISNQPAKSADVGGHDGHDGPVWYEGITGDWGDIIPPFEYLEGTTTVQYSGKNWTSEGQAIWENGCSIPSPKTVWLEISKAVYPGEFTGTLDNEDFAFHITGGGVDATVAHGEKIELPVGTYAVTESYTGSDPVGFDAEDWTAEWDGDICDLDDAITATEPGTLVVLDGDVGKYTEGNPGRCTVSNTFDPVPVLATDMTFELVKKFSGPVPDGYTADQFTFNIAGVASDIPLTARTDDEAYATITLAIGSYELTENGPLGFVPADWTIQWSGAGCEAVTATATTITIDPADLDKTNFGCRADNQWKPVVTDTCDDETALNYGEVGQCEYPPVTCDDPYALNYGETGACEYDQPNQCVPAEPGWADAVVSSNQGETKGAGAIADPKRTDPEAALGAADWSNGDSDGFFSLGFGGSIVVSFGPDGFVTDEEGNDISIHEATNGATYPEEKALVEVSQDGSAWYEVGTASNLTDVTTRVSYFDIATTGLAWIKYVRVTDTSDPSLHVPAADGFDLDAVDTTKTVCTEPENGGGNGNNDSDTYIIEGYVWHDDNENSEWDGFNDEEASTTEDQLTGWTVKIVNEGATLSYSTTTDPTGYYYFEVPAGTWTITEVLEDGWTLITPASGSHVVTVPEVLTQSFAERLFAMIIPTAHAAVLDVFGPFNFGNDFTGSGGGSTTGGGSTSTGGGSSSGGGGGSVRPVCEALDLSAANGLYTLTWETRRGDELSITQNGTEIYFTDTDADVDSGSALVTTDNADFVLTVSRGSRSDTCELSPEDGAGAPEGQVLGEQVSVVPLGAADAGAGGTSPQMPQINTLVAAFLRRTVKNEA